MKTRKIMNIGDVFLTWEVKELVNPKKYRYKCVCTDCGQSREFIKYNLLKGSYAPCKKCGHKKIGNIPLIKKHWNSELNGTIFTSPEHFSLTQSYWFICNKGHNFKSSIKDFSLDRCLGCSEVPPNHPSKIQAKEYAIQYFKVLGRVVEYKPFLLYIKERNIALYIVEEDRYTSYKNYFESEGAMLKEFEMVLGLEREFSKIGAKFIVQKVEKNLKNNVDIFKELMIRLVHELDID